MASCFTLKGDGLVDSFLNVVIFSSDKSDISLTVAAAVDRIQFVKSVKDLNVSQVIKSAIFDSTVDPKDILWLRETFSSMFIAVCDSSLMNEPGKRYELFQVGANMVAYESASFLSVIENSVLHVGHSGGIFTCPMCGLSGLTEDELWHHFPTFHINCPNEKTSRRCPICHEMLHQPLQVHIHDDHGPEARARGKGRPPPEKDVVVLHSYSLVVCRHPYTGKFLLCQEFGNQGFWVPGGAVDAGEDLITAAKRETQEEAGVAIAIKGILSMDYLPVNHRGHHFVQLRVTFYAEPLDANEPPKCVPDFESLGAAWCSTEQIRTIPLRGSEPRKWSEYLSEGGEIYPISILAQR